MNEMIEVKRNPSDLVWEVDRKFKRLKGKVKYHITDMKHKHLFVNFLLAHQKYPLRQQKFQTQAEALQEALQLEENQYKHTDLAVEDLRAYLKNLTF